MQDPTDPAEASIPTGNGRIVRRMSGTMRRRVGKRTMPIPSPPSQQYPVSPAPSTPPSLLDEDVPVAKRPRLETLISTYPDSVSDSDTWSIHIASQRNRIDTVPSEIAFASRTLFMTAAASHQESTTPTTSTADNINKHTVAPPPAQKDPFTPEEDDKLTRAVKQLGCENWVAVAALVPGRTNSQCRRRWGRFLDPTNDVEIKMLGAERESKPRTDLPQKDLPLGRWTAQEDAKLRVAVQKYGTNYVKVASEVPGRTRVTCRKRWVMYLGATERTTGRWTAEEDAKLASALKAFGRPKRNWIAISAVVQSRTPTQCYERFALLSDTGDRRNGKWALMEDANLITAVRTHGRNWEAVAPLVRGKTSDQCRKRWTWMNASEQKTDQEKGELIE
jgi:hypothetical protein